MSLRNPSNPKEMRRTLHATYEPYAQGIVNFPRGRLSGSVEDFPERTQPIVRALTEAWAQIDDGRKVHRALVNNVLEDPKAALTDKEGNVGKGMVVSKIGRNALVEVVFIPVFEEGLVAIQTTRVGPRSAVEEYLEQHRVTLMDGRTITASGFDGGQTPDIEIPVLMGQDRLGHVVHFDSRLNEAA